MSENESKSSGKVVPIHRQGVVRTASYRQGEYHGDPEAIAEMKAHAALAQAREQKRREVWGPSGEHREWMRRLCRSFPSLMRVPGTAPWTMGEEPEGAAAPFLEWMCSGAPSHGALLAGRFVLSVWSSSTDWTEVATESGLKPGEALKRFDLFEAMAVWDDAHVQAFSRWVELPFWP